MAITYTIQPKCDSLEAGLIPAGFTSGDILLSPFLEVQVRFVSSICFLAALTFPLQSAFAQNSPDKFQNVAPYAAAGGAPQQSVPPNYTPAAPVTYVSTLGSPYVPVDSWIYPALTRLQGLGYVDTAFLGLRPWTRLSILHMLQQTADKIEGDTNNDEAREIYLALLHEVSPEFENDYGEHAVHAQVESVYTQMRGISGTPLRDSYHLGQSIVNDYGRPYQEGFNNYTGFSAHSEAGRFALYFRGEYQHAPSASGYSPALFQYLSEDIDGIPVATNPNQATIPLGPIASVNTFRVQEAALSYNILNHSISFGKNDHWWGPGQGGAFAFSNNAENIYSFQIDRTEPLRIPLLSRLTGPFRYQFFIGSLKGHTYPNAPWIHGEKLSFKPTENLEFGFERTVIWGGKGHGCLNSVTGNIDPCTEPITLHTFLKSFFSVQNVTGSEKFSRNDPGARFGTFDFSYRLPYLRKWLTLYSDSLVHDDVSPISAPRRAGIRPGIYLSHFPGLDHLDLRVEAVSTDPVSNSTAQGQFLYYETVQRQGYTNKGSIMGDWIGRQAKGGQAWLTYHLSPKEQIQFSYRNAKASVLQTNKANPYLLHGFLPGGTTQNDYQFGVVKRVLKDIELNGWVQYEQWKAPLYK